MKVFGHHPSCWKRRLAWWWWCIRHPRGCRACGDHGAWDSGDGDVVVCPACEYDPKWEKIEGTLPWATDPWECDCWVEDWARETLDKGTWE